MSKFNYFSVLEEEEKHEKHSFTQNVMAWDGSHSSFEPLEDMSSQGFFRWRCTLQSVLSQSRGMTALCSDNSFSCNVVISIIKYVEGYLFSKWLSTFLKCIFLVESRWESWKSKGKRFGRAEDQADLKESCPERFGQKCIIRKAKAMQWPRGGAIAGNTFRPAAAK